MRGIPIVLTEKQEKWFKKHFPNTKNAEIAKKLEISQSSVNHFAKKFGLTKTKQFMKKCAKEASKKGCAVKAVYNLNIPKGFVIPNSEKYRFKKGENSLQRFGKYVEKRRIKRATEARNKVLRLEKARVAFGLPQRTKLKIGKQPRAKILLRYYLKKRGYVIDEEQRIVYYNENTRRGKRVESSDQPWYKFKQLE